MRRSKSNPAKYARNYRSISQRRMTEYDHIDEEKEMERLRKVLRESEVRLQQNNPSAGIEEEPTKKKKKTNRRRQREEPKEDTDATMVDSILSEEMREDDNQGYGVDEDSNALVMISKKKGKKPTTKQKQVELTPQEIRQAKLAQKNTSRKLKQLAARAEQKKRRDALYAKLRDTSISAQERELLSSSSELGKRTTKRETLKRLLQKERAGIKLTQDEHNTLYDTREVQDCDNQTVDASTPTPSSSTIGENQAKQISENDDTRDPSMTNNKTKKKNKKKRKRDDDADESTDGTKQLETSSSIKDNEENPSNTKAAVEKDGQVKEETEPVEQAKVAAKSGPETIAAPFNFAAAMMSSMNSLKRKIEEEKVEKPEEQPSSELERLAKEEEKRPKKTSYVPSEPVVLKTAAAIGLEPSRTKRKVRKVLPIRRPPEVEAKRFDLPVSGMEYEIVDSIRNNDVTIICSETGSGKSTQVPQFLYEGGFTMNEGTSSLMIGITQPRRVAAVSTAKRVCFEMGHGDGQSVKSAHGGNLVCYQTRYESAGLGNDTRVKFMTDGILLQEIQSDLLLRRYSVIVLDEAHERNLNTDVLLGMISVAIPLRKEAAVEKGSHLVPLKLVVMSATLRVEDFTENKKLFPETPPAVVSVPGRTHPVTIHHSKVTELDDYETAAFKKICGIHRKLPAGGILVFLTGKQEILRMVKRLRSALGESRQRDRASPDIAPHDVDPTEGGPRDMDDDEVDGEVIDEENDDFSIEEGMAETYESLEFVRDENDKIPKNVIILPLYSMLSVEAQAKVFAPVQEGYRLIVVATNIAETSITIPGVSYVVDSGRQKCRSFHSGTGMASYDVTWISKAAADQRSGRAGRTGPGHCYRLYSSTMYSRHMQDYALPEVLTRPLEDVVLAMKAMKVSNVANFPFPTPPDQSQIDGAVKLLANLGCVSLENDEIREDDGVITRLGSAVAKLPLGVRYGKMLLVAAQAGVLDYAIAIVAVLSENSPFLHGQHDSVDDDKNDDHVDDDDEESERKNEKPTKWSHRDGDILAGMLALGAYTYASRGAGGASEASACRQFCEKNDLSYGVMLKIQKVRTHLARLAKLRLSTADGFAAKTGGIVSTMKPPSKLQENLLCQAIMSGLLDQVAMLAPPGALSGDHPYGFRTAYLSSSASIREPLFMDPRSTLFSRNPRLLPDWVCFDTLVRKTTKDGTPIASMKRITRIDPSWLGALAKGSRLLSVGDPINSRPPMYDPDVDSVMCSAMTKFGTKGWEIAPVRVVMFDALQTMSSKQKSGFLLDDSFRWFARFLLEGKVLKKLKELRPYLNDDPAIITRRTPVAKVALLVSALSSAGIDSCSALRKQWTERNRKFLFKHLKDWIKPEDVTDAKQIWMDCVKQNIKLWKAR